MSAGRLRTVGYEPLLGREKIADALRLPCFSGCAAGVVPCYRSTEPNADLHVRGLMWNERHMWVSHKNIRRFFSFAFFLLHFLGLSFLLLLFLAKTRRRANWADNLELVCPEEL